MTISSISGLFFIAWMMWISFYVIRIRRTQHAAKDVFEELAHEIEKLQNGK
jgi:hypothetical protein